MGKNQKEHRRKVSRRNEEIKNQQKKVEKMRQDFLQNLIDKENSMGKFNNPTQPTPSELPFLEIGQGPMI